MAPEEIAALMASEPSFGQSVVPRLNALRAAGAFDDWPAAGATAMPVKWGSSRPFCDDFTAAIGHAALWFAETLGPDLPRCWAELRTVTAPQGGRQHRKHLLAYRKEWLASWTGNSLAPGLQFPYAFRIRSPVSRSADAATSVCAAWPPPTLQVVRKMVSLLQSAHMVILLLAMAPRDGELADLARDCLEEVRHQDLAVGYTFQLSASAGGERRNWPLPKVAVQAIRQQQKLAEVMDPAGDRLWVELCRNDRGEGGRVSCQEPLVAFSERVLTSDGRSLSEICDGRVQTRRFRKTVVRLAALSLVGANQILFDVLGHRDPEMTLNYILSDPDLQDELRQIAHEAAVALAKEAFLSADANGGPAAPAVKSLATRLAPRGAEMEMDVRALDEAAEVLSQNGRVMLVKPNVLCTKTFNQFGPCSRRAGNPDIGDCQGDCVHRLEMAAAKADRRRAIGQILESIPGDPCMMRTWWQAQLLSHLMPFADLRREMLADARVRAALVGISQHSVDMLEERHREAARALVDTAT